jgi:hypothetical protein
MIPEREALASAIERHRDAAAEHERTEAAFHQLEDRFFVVLQPALRAALDQLHETKRLHPQRLVASALGEPPPDDGGLSVYAAEKALSEAERAVDDAREARKLIAQEAEAKRATEAIARQAVDRCVTEVLAASPEVEALRDEYVVLRQRFSAVIGALRAAGVHGLWPLALDETAFANSEWEAALRLLREDADASLPPLPQGRGHRRSDAAPA